MFTKLIALAVAYAAFASGCASNSDEGEAQETIDNLIQAGYPAGDIQVIDGKVYVGNDAEVSLLASREMLRTGPGKEQYRTTNLVAGPTPAIICINGTIFTDPILNVGLNRALENYNQLFQAGISRLFFFRVDGTIAGCNFFINSVIMPGVNGGMSGFPSGGAPYGTLRIGDGFLSSGDDVAEWVFTHEIGPTIGLRHSDFFDRSISCGGAAVNEEDPPSGLGAILIPGTPSGATQGGSIMNSCFRPKESGEFTSSDITAIDALY